LTTDDHWIDWYDKIPFEIFLLFKLYFKMKYKSILWKYWFTGLTIYGKSCIKARELVK
jgi:hypothetical protein